MTGGHKLPHRHISMVRHISPLEKESFVPEALIPTNPSPCPMHQSAGTLGQNDRARHEELQEMMDAVARLPSQEDRGKKSGRQEQNEKTLLMTIASARVPKDKASRDEDDAGEDQSSRRRVVQTCWLFERCRYPPLRELFRCHVSFDPLRETKV